MAIVDSVVQTTDRNERLDRMLLVIVVDGILGNDERGTRKIRLRQGDLSASQTVTGQQLYNVLVDNIGLELTSTLGIFDTENQRFKELPLEETDIASRFGRCIRCTALRVGLEPEQSTPPTIMGRFFPYDPSEGLEIAGTKICVQETPNIPGAGTGLNVWDGAVLL
jgi:hypothetical protein